jgi:hypothetical protein
MPIKVAPLPQQYNWMSAFGHPPDDVRLVHRAGNHTGMENYWKRADEMLKSGRAFEQAVWAPKASGGEPAVAAMPTQPPPAVPARKAAHPPKKLSKPRPRGD